MVCPVAFTACVLLAACSNDDKGMEVENGQMSLKITVTTTPTSSRAMTEADESTINNLMVLLFEPDASSAPSRLYKVVMASGVSSSGNGYLFDARFGVDRSTTPANLAVVVLANVGDMLDDAIALIGKRYSDVRAALVKEDAAQDSYLTCWGVATTVIDTSLKAQAISISLLRDRARIDVLTDTEKVSSSLFQLRSLHLIKPSTKIALIPDPANITANVALKPSLPTGMLPSDIATVWRATDGHSIIGMAYAAEADVRMGENAEVNDGNRLNRPALIIGGVYRKSSVTPEDEEKVSYYRVDFLHDGELIDILRNHLYRITITAVNGPGESTPEEAYRTISAAISADIIEWSDLNQDVAIDGQNWIAMQKDITIGPEKDASVVIQLSTNVNPEFWLGYHWSDINPDDTSSEWHDMSVLFVAELPTDIDEDGNAQLTVRTLSALPSDMDSRSSRLQINITPRLGIIVVITQKRLKNSSGNGTGNNPWEDQNIYGEI